MLQRAMILCLMLLLVGCASRSAGGDDNLATLPAATMVVKNMGAVQLFEIEVGKIVSDGVPEPGAGNLEMSHAADIYVFRLDAAQEIVFDAQGETAPILWELSNREGQVIFPGSRLTTGADPGLFALDAGTYIITVKGQGAAFGTYQFLLREA